MMVVLLKITLLLSLALAILPLMPRAGAALRHLVCLGALAGSLLLPLTLLQTAVPTALRIRIHAANAVWNAMPPATSRPGRIPFFIWASVASLLAVRIAWGFISLSRLQATSTPLSEGIYEANVPVPIVCGLLQPRILLPRGANRWPPDRLNAVLLHERAHIRRKDLWTNLLAQMACVVYWFHPLVWLVARALRREQELACDDSVLHSGVEPGSYAEALVAAAHQLTSTPLITGCPMLTPKTFKSRVARVLDPNMPRAVSSAAFLRTALLCAATLTAIGLISPVRAADGDVYKVGNGVSAPSVTFRVDPAYTAFAKDAKIEGTVLLSVVVGPDGTARDYKVIKSLEPGLDSSAITAVQQWRFTPGKKQGEPVSVRAQIEISFRLL